MDEEDVPKPKSLKETHPQKHFLKTVCRYLYYMGIGDCWYEKTERSKTHKIFYGIWVILVNTFIILGTINEVLANFRLTELTPKEKTDLIQFTFAHPCLSAKYIILVFQKDRVRDLFKRMMEDTRHIYFSLELDKASVKKAIRYVITLNAVTYGCLIAALMDGIRAHFQEGIPIRTEVVLYPTRAHSGPFINFLRFMVEFHWYTIVTNMLLVDGISISSLIFLGFKFKLVRRYFEDLRKRAISNVGTKSDKELRQEFERDFKLGIKLHENALWCATNVQYAVGNIYSVQTLESISLICMCLVRLVTTERNMVFTIAILTYIACLLVLTGSYFIAAGEITYQASNVCTAMFYSGFDMVSTSKPLRALAVVAIQRSQVPVYMTAFGVVILSHSNFISVLRSSYSFFLAATSTSRR